MRTGFLRDRTLRRRVPLVRLQRSYKQHSAGGNTQPKSLLQTLEVATAKKTESEKDPSTRSPPVPRANAVTAMLPSANLDRVAGRHEGTAVRAPATSSHEIEVFRARSCHK